MTINVLVVDDSAFFRRRVCELLKDHPQLKVIGTAVNGKDAIDQARVLNPDVITMDYEMPVMDGITAVREITRTQAIPVLMFSSLTYEGARVTLDALEAGAVDYLPKNLEEISRHPDEMQSVLCDRIITVARSRPRPHVRPIDTPAPVERRTADAGPSAPRPVRGNRAGNCALLVIGASTGGPMALQRLLTTLPAELPVPILLVQHMPATFTKAFAERLDRLCRINVCEASDGMLMKPGCAYLSPGGQQMLVDGRNHSQLRVVAGDERLHYKPSLDVTFGSVAMAYAGRVLGIVLTGMGADGREGARLLKARGARIWVQDESSCVIYGMPMAIAKAGLADEQHSLDRIGERLHEEFA